MLDGRGFVTHCGNQQSIRSRHTLAARQPHKLEHDRIFAGTPTAQGIPYTGFSHERDGSPYENLAWVVAREQQAGQLGTGPDTEFAVGACEVGFHGFAGDE